MKKNIRGNSDVFYRSIVVATSMATPKHHIEGDVWGYPHSCWLCEQGFEPVLPDHSPPALNHCATKSPTLTRSEVLLDFTNDVSEIKYFRSISRTANTFRVPPVLLLVWAAKHHPYIEGDVWGYPLSFWLCEQGFEPVLPDHAPPALNHCATKSLTLTCSEVLLDFTNDMREIRYFRSISRTAYTFRVPPVLLPQWAGIWTSVHRSLTTSA